MLDKEKMLEKIDSMAIDDLAVLVCQALTDAGIPYTEGEGYIEFDGLHASEIEGIDIAFYPTITMSGTENVHQYQYTSSCINPEIMYCSFNQVQVDKPKFILIHDVVAA